MQIVCFLGPFVEQALASFFLLNAISLIQLLLATKECLVSAFTHYYGNKGTCVLAAILRNAWPSLQDSQDGGNSLLLTFAEGFLMSGGC